MRNNASNILLGLVLFVVSMLLSLGAAETILRVKNSSMKNYDIEMWRYAKEIKFPSPDPELGHEHKANANAILQGVEVRTNQEGLRGQSVLTKQEGRRDILFLGSSITFGWGVKENETTAKQVESLFEKDGVNVRVLNAGIGNYNAPRYVSRFFKRLKHLEISDVVVQYFLRDAEILEKGGGNWFLKNSQLAVTLWTAFGRLFSPHGENILIDHYQRVYAKDSEGRAAMEKSLGELSQYAKGKGIRTYLAMVPDVHNLTNYPFQYIHDMMKETSTSLGYQYVDLLPALSGLKPEEVWSLPGDPHPNALGHSRMAMALYPVLNRAPESVRMTASEH